MYVHAIQPFLPWAIGAGVLLLFHVWFRRWSVRYSEAVVVQLQTQAGKPLLNTGRTAPLDDSPLAVHCRVIWQHLDSLPPDEEQRIASLVSDLATVKLLRQFETAYHMIFASQVFFLRNLNLVNGTASRPETEKFFAERTQQNPDLKKITVDAWVRFLVIQEFVMEDGGGFRITKLGEEFLVWMVRNKIPDKPDERF